MNTRLAVLVSSVVVLCACPRPCEVNNDCDDGLYCNGVETCEAKVCKPGVTPSCDDGLACTTDVCVEDRRACVSRPPDADGDGQADVKCVDARGAALGTDCDDRDARRAPGFLEVCDVMNHDEDCDLTTFGGIDSDSDGYEDSRCGNTFVDGGVARGLDCNDANPGIHPGLLEVCNGSDDNCNGETDEGVLATRYTDADNDGWGSGQSMQACITTPGTSHLGTDCDDTNPAFHPGQFRCVLGGQGTDYALCNTDGGQTVGRCPVRCAPQPNGIGVCL